MTKDYHPVSTETQYLLDMDHNSFLNKGASNATDDRAFTAMIVDLHVGDVWTKQETAWRVALCGMGRNSVGIVWAL